MVTLLTMDAASMMSSVWIIVLMFVFMYFFIISPQKKKDKQVAAMRAAIEVGDEVLTAGGIIGTVVSTKDETILIETGSDRVKIRIARYAVSENITKLDEQRNARIEKEAAAKAAKESKKNEGDKK